MPPIKLGKQYKDCGAPHGAILKGEEEGLHYPNLYIDLDEEADIPEEGTMTVKFKRVRKSEDERMGETKFGYELEIHSIEGVSKVEVEDGGGDEDDAEEAFDRVAKAVRSKKDDE